MLAVALRVSGQGDGIYADFTTTMGNFTCRLEYATAPKAVANFMGLAAGQRAWLDLPTGLAKTNAFYNGLTFHRVIAGFMIQGGSPNGQGTDGPGYTFVDEFSPSLRFDGAGVLAMANSGPDSNGSQFFVTVAATAWLNDVHTIFGRAVAGTNVVIAISQVASDANSRPLTNVVIQSIGIRRVGAAAQAFDVQAQKLPLVTNRNMTIAWSGANVSLTFSNNLYADDRLYASTNLTQWRGSPLGIMTTAAPNTVLTSASLPARFFRMAQIQYQDSLFVPPNVLGRLVTLNFTGANGTITVTFDNSGGGSYTWSLGPPGIVTYTWVQDAYRGRLSPILFYGGVSPMVLHLDFDNATSGTFKGTAYPYYPSSTGSGPVSGTFTASP